MEQGRLRVGDTLDDYCPRERRLTTHAVVALVEDRVKQTRCMTCDFEHAFKEGKVPPRRKKTEAHAGLSPALDREPAPQIVSPPKRPHAPEAHATALSSQLVASSEQTAPAALAAPSHEDRPTLAPLSSVTSHRQPGMVGDHHELAVHRRLIRATLPRQEGQLATPRPIPEFTVRHAPGGGTHRWGEGHGTAGSKTKSRGDRGHFGAARQASGGHRRGGHAQRFGKKGGPR